MRRVRKRRKERERGGRLRKRRKNGREEGRLRRRRAWEEYSVCHRRLAVTKQRTTSIDTIGDGLQSEGRKDGNGNENTQSAIGVWQRWEARAGTQSTIGVWL
jgi:hypothetical protein